MAAIPRLLSRTVALLAVTLAAGVVAFLGVAPHVVGGATLTVLTGSMSPTIPAGSVVLIRPVEDPLDIAPGTVITFQTSPTERTLVTHRVVRSQPDTTPPSYVTKGDANPGEDLDPVPVGAIRGEVVAHVPHLGRVSQLLGAGRGPYLVLVLGASMVIATQLRRLVRALRSSADPADAAPGHPADDAGPDDAGGRASTPLVAADAGGAPDRRS